MRDEPKSPYVFQPFGVLSHPQRAKSGRLYGVGGVSRETTIEGLTRREAEAVVAALTTPAPPGPTTEEET